ncbi:hypothetical protein GCK72_003922 [Caenorhabditis remanei]|uniref:Uncharacterized protein n=1 Tax=Caenorhabditis remanei TaxID=31234 RepID=A0A6A5HAV1_CAERE|nr:hypothetical protein GCK72_003922 [Caenorhabditis remanei]KAF1763976.1 hypothetical protein GCK72_003922 [Caenorhabditis remanei]
MTPRSEGTIRKLVKQVADGEDIITALKSLAVLDIPLALSTDLQLVDLLTPLSGSPLLNGSIHEILKKLEGKKGKESNGKSSILKPVRRVSKGGSYRKRRSSGVTKKIPVEIEVKKAEEKKEDVKENQKATTTSTRLFKKNEPKKKESAIWKKIKKVQG